MVDKEGMSQMVRMAGCEQDRRNVPVSLELPFPLNPRGVTKSGEVRAKGDWLLFVVVERVNRGP